jgi:hypothetical protein
MRRCRNSSISVAPPQTLGRLGQQVLRKIVRVLVGAQLRIEPVLMAEAF